METSKKKQDASDIEQDNNEILNFLVLRPVQYSRRPHLLFLLDNSVTNSDFDYIMSQTFRLISGIFYTLFTKNFQVHLAWNKIWFPLSKSGYGFF